MTDTAEQASLLLLSKLSRFLDNPTIKIEASPSQEIVVLQEQIKCLQAEKDKLELELKRSQQLYYDEVNRNLRMEDICRLHGVDWRKYR